MTDVVGFVTYDWWDTPCRRYVLMMLTVLVTVDSIAAWAAANVRDVSILPNCIAQCLSWHNSSRQTLVVDLYRFTSCFVELLLPGLSSLAKTWAQQFFDARNERVLKMIIGAPSIPLWKMGCGSSGPPQIAQMFHASCTKNNSEQ